MPNNHTIVYPHSKTRESLKIGGIKPYFNRKEFNNCWIIIIAEKRKKKKRT